MTGKKRSLISIILLCAGILLILAGIFRGEAAAVFSEGHKNLS